MSEFEQYQINVENASICRISSSQYDFLINLYDTYSFYPPGYQFNPKFKHGHWDGKIRLFSIANRSFPVGLIPRLLKDFPLKEIDNDINFCFKTDYTDKEIENFVGQFSFFSHGKPIVPREDQMRAIKHSIQNKRSVLVCPTSFGKSLCIFIQCLWHIIIYKYKIVLIVPTIDLVEQFYNDILDYCTNSKGEVEDWFPKIIKISSLYNETPIDHADIVITTWQSVMSITRNKDPQWVNKNFQCLILDESHKAKGTEIQKIASGATKIFHRTGWTGSLKSNSNDALVVESCFGPPVEITTLSKLMEIGRAHV